MSFWRRLRSTFNPASARERAEEEARFHLDMKASEYEDRGLGPKEASTQARREFGNLLQHQEETGNRDVFAGLEALAMDARVAWRRLRKSPVFLATSVVLLAFGIGVNTAVFSVVDHLLLRPLPLPEAERLVVIEELRDGQKSNSNPARMADWGARVAAFELTASQYGEVVALDQGDGRRGVQVLRAVGDWISVLGLVPIEGRNISKNDENVALLTQSGRRYGKLGDKLRLGEASFEVIGIVPDEAVLGEDVGIITPAPASVMKASRKAGFLSVIARLKPNAANPLAQAQAQAAAVSMGKDFPATDRNMTVNLIDAQKAWTEDLRSSAWMLQAASLVLLLITIANLAALLAARTMDRAKESKIRTSLGASRWSILRLHLVEASLVSLFGSLAAALVATWALAFIQSSFSDKFAPLMRVTLDARVFGYLFALGLVSALACTVVMASRSSLGVRASGLVVIEAALGLLLVSAAFGLASEFAERRSRPLGFAPQNVVVARVDMPWSADDKDVQQVINGGLERFAALPGVTSVGIVDRLPLGGGTQSAHAHIRGLTEPTKQDIGFRMGNASYFMTMKIPLLAGAPLGEKDAVVVNEVLSRRYFKGNPIGQYISNDGKKFWRIAGVVGNVRTDPKAPEAMPEVWLPYQQWSWPKLEFVLSTNQSPAALAPTIRKMVSELSPMALLDQVSALDQRLEKVDLEPRRSRDVLALFGLVALCLVVAGVYGVMAGESLRRTREMGIRLAVGASPANVFGLILRQAVILAGASLLLSIPFGLYSGYLEPRMLFLAGLTIAASIVLAAAWPAWRASRIAPSTALRTE